MATYSIPVDALVYRVLCRLGIVNPNIDKYLGENSPADLKIQTVAVKIFPGKPWLLDEALWSTGRQAARGGHCFPRQPKCLGCLFTDICPRNFLSIDPSPIGMSHMQRVEGLSLPEKEVNDRQRQFASFVEDLRKKGITGQEYREKIMKWFREYQE